jgi:hypothetical protein
LAPADKFAEHLVRILQQHPALPYSINVSKLVAILTSIKDIKFNTHMKFLSFNIKKLYTNTLSPPPTKIKDNMLMQHHIAVKLLPIEGQSTYTKKLVLLRVPPYLPNFQTYF